MPQAAEKSAPQPLIQRPRPRGSVEIAEGGRWLEEMKVVLVPLPETNCLPMNQIHHFSLVNTIKMVDFPWLC